MSQELGLRERKKQATRQLIADTARRLFVERGFEHVKIAEIARVAEVSEQTVFNYFRTKEDLVYWRLESFEDELLAAVRERDSGESFLAAFGRFVMQQRGLLAERDPETAKRLEGITRMISESPSLLAREQQVFDRYTESLSALIAQETGAERGDVQASVVANALIGVHRSLVHYTRAQILAGTQPPKLARDVRKQGERGLGDYGAR